MQHVSINRAGTIIQVLTTNHQLRILQVTDLHLSSVGVFDRFCLQSVRALARKFKADIVACTGDLFGLRTIRSMQRTARLFDQIVGSSTPWLFSWGNHDQELKSFDVEPVVQFDAVERYLEQLPNCLYVQSRQFMENYRGTPINEDPWEQDALSTSPPQAWDAFYGGNYLMEITNPAGTGKAWNIFVLNSRRGFHVPPKVLNWVSDQASKDPTVPCICFYHVPNHEYDDIWNRGLAKGIKRENVCFERDRGRVHQVLKALGNIKAVFVGHDHINDYHGEVDGITYVYGRKTCLGGYGSYRKLPNRFKNEGKGIKIGAKLITLSLDNENPALNACTHVSVFSDGTSWMP